jgi:hypothetical protein
MEVACGQCLGCRLDYRRMWAARINHEAAMHEYNAGNCFITLTYRDKSRCDEEQWLRGKHVPDDWSLNKKHFRDFMKRLRKHFGEQKVRFYHCGEYGNVCKHGVRLDVVRCPLCNVGRPHYHAALFNCDFSDLEAYETDDYGDFRYTSPTLERLWGFGNVDVGDLNYESAAYIAGYVMEKITGVKADDHYYAVSFDGEVTYLQPEYATMSRGRPCADHDHITVGCDRCDGGIGWSWFNKYKDDVFPRDQVPVVGKGVLKKAPRYYETIYAEENATSLEEVKRIRQEFRKAHEHDYTPERLLDKYKVLAARESLKSKEL